jgi:hypothetical protein
MKARIHDCITTLAVVLFGGLYYMGFSEMFDAGKNVPVG